MAGLTTPWTAVQDARVIRATFRVPAGPVLLLTVSEQPGTGLWHAVVDMRDAFGSWAAPVLFGECENAELWCERQADAIASAYPHDHPRRPR